MPLAAAVLRRKCCTLRPKLAGGVGLVALAADLSVVVVVVVGGGCFGDDGAVEACLWLCLLGLATKRRPRR